MTRSSQSLFELTPDDYLSNEAFLKHYDLAKPSRKKELLEDPRFFAALIPLLDDALTYLSDTYRDDLGYPPIESLIIPADPAKALKLYIDILFFCEANALEDTSKFLDELEELSTKKYNTYATYFLIQLKLNELIKKFGNSTSHSVEDIISMTEEAHKYLEYFDEKNTLYYFTRANIYNTLSSLYENIGEDVLAGECIKQLVISLTLYCDLKDEEPRSLNNILKSDYVDRIFTDENGESISANTLLDSLKNDLPATTLESIDEEVKKQMKKIDLKLLNDNREEIVYLSEEEIVDIQIKYQPKG